MLNGMTGYVVFMDVNTFMTISLWEWYLGSFNDYFVVILAKGSMQYCKN